jgi:hypothetical protein
MGMKVIKHASNNEETNGTLSISRIVHNGNVFVFNGSIKLFFPNNISCKECEITLNKLGKLIESYYIEHGGTIFIP